MISALPALAGLTGTANAVRFINLALGIVVAGIDVAGKLAALDDRIAAFVAEGRDPTDAEWADLEGRSDAAHAAIQGSGPPPAA